MTAKKKYGRKAEEKISKVMHEWKHGDLHSGGSGRKVKDREQAIAIGISEARRAGAKVPPAPNKSSRTKKTAQRKRG